MVAHAVWTAKEEDVFFSGLASYFSEAGDGGNFKKPTFEKVLLEVAPHHSRGAPKTVAMLQSKFAAAKKIYRIIEDLKAVSGWTWCDVNGCNINPHNAASWDEYIRHHPGAKPFRNKGWRHLECFEKWMPRFSAARGTNVTYPSQSLVSVEELGSLNEDDSEIGAETLFSQAIPDVDSESRSPTPGPSSQSSHVTNARPATPTRHRRIRPKSGAGALSDLADSMTKFGDTLAAALAPPADAVPSTPRRRLDAVAAFRTNERDRLSCSDFVIMLGVLSKDITACDIYMLFADDQDVRETWIEAQVDQALSKSS